MKYQHREDTLTITDLVYFDLARSCECGQAFRWHRYENGFLGIVSGRAALLTQEKDTLTVFPCQKADIPFWFNYLDLERDYSRIERGIFEHPKMCSCVCGSCGIHVFRQDPFETLISFIISANNNVKRIMGTIEKLCILAGDPIETPFGIQYTFPTPAKLAECSEDKLRECGTGYRAPYIQKTAELIRDGFPLEALRDMPLAQARKEITRLPGVGPKVADCILLYSLGHDDAFPLDVWMKRVMRTMFFNGTEPPKSELEQVISGLGAEAGIIQQYLFHYARSMKIEG